MASTRPFRPDSEGGQAGKAKSRISRELPKRGKYRPRTRPVEIATLGQRIRASRMALGLTQKELGERLHTDQTTVSAWENGKAKKLAGPSLVALAELFGVPPDALLTGKGFRVPEETVSVQAFGSGPRKGVVIQLPQAPPGGHLVWVEGRSANSESPRVLEGEAALEEIKKALVSNRKLWVVVQ